MSKRKNKSVLFWVTVALVFFANPNIRIFDILPDFIACFIVARVLRYGVEKVPYFEEARASFIKLGWVTLLKLPAFYLMTMVRSGNVSDNDITALLSLVFSVIEIVIFIGAIKNLFSALFYLGERSDCSSLISKFAISKRGSVMAPEALQSLTVFFVILKLAMATLPEFMLLTKLSDTGAHVANLSLLLYPYALVLAIMITLAFGIHFYKRWHRYVKAIHGEGKFFSAIDSLVSAEAAPAVENKLRAKALTSALTLVAVASVFAFELRVDEYGSINVIPPFIMGIILLVAIRGIGKHTRGTMLASASCALYTLFTTVAYVADIYFLDSYSYVDLEKSSAAMLLYSAVIFVSAIAFIAFLIYTLFMTKLIFRYIGEHTGIPTTDERYSRADRDRHASLKRSAVIYAVCSVAMAAMKLFALVLRYSTKSELVESIEGIVDISMTSLPWFGTATFVVGVINIIAAVSLVSRLKEDTLMKYSSN